MASSIHFDHRHKQPRSKPRFQSHSKARKVWFNRGFSSFTTFRAELSSAATWALGRVSDKEPDFAIPNLHGLVEEILDGRLDSSLLGPFLG